MHSKIFQITRTRVSQDDYLNESTLAQGDNSFFDYCGEIDEAERKFHIDNLVLEWIGPVYQLEKYLKNPLDTAYWFYMDEEGLQSHAEQSYEFMRQVCEFEPGTLLYIGGVIDYHF